MCCYYAGVNNESEERISSLDHHRVLCASSNNLFSGMVFPTEMVNASTNSSWGRIGGCLEIIGGEEMVGTVGKWSVV